MLRALLAAALVSSACASASPEPTSTPEPTPPSAPPVSSPSDTSLPNYPLDLRGALEFGRPVRVAVLATRNSVCTFTARPGAEVVFVIGPTYDSMSVGLFGPVPASGSLGDAPRWAGALARTEEGAYGETVIRVQARLADAGTYLVGLNENDVTVALTLTCVEGECRPECAADGTCPGGSTCARAACDEGPCLSYCLPPNAGDVPSEDFNAGTLITPED